VYSCAKMFSQVLKTNRTAHIQKSLWSLVLFLVLSSVSNLCYFFDIKNQWALGKQLIFVFLFGFTTVFPTQSRTGLFLAFFCCLLVKLSASRGRDI
jgi:hypothetical protein